MFFNGMHRCRTFLFRLALLLGGPLVFWADAGSPADSFLDQPLPSSIALETQSDLGWDGKSPAKTYRMLETPSFWKGVQLLGAMTGKNVLLPPQLGEWPDERSETNWKGSSIGPGDVLSIRELFERLCQQLGVIWRYDSTDDSIRLEPKWRRIDSRPSKELVNALLGSRPVRWTDLPDGARNGVGGIDSALDGWRLAFDALLSRSENFPTAGTLRFYHDTHGRVPFGPHPVENLFTGKMSAAGGRQQMIVLNGQGTFTTKDDPGDVAYYLFDEDGKFTGGGVYGITEGWVGYVTKAEMADDRTLTLAVAGMHRAAPVSLHFKLVHNDLVLVGSTDEKGIERSAQDTREAYPAYHGEVTRLKYRVTARDER